MNNLNLKNLNLIQKKVGKQNLQRLDKANDAYHEAVKLIAEFNKTGRNKSLLINASEKLVEVIENNRPKAEPYYYLAYIFYVLDNDKLAIKYLKAGKSLENISGFDKLSDLLENNTIKPGSKRYTSTQTNSKTLNNSDNKPVKVKKLARIKKLQR